MRIFKKTTLVAALCASGLIMSSMGAHAFSVNLEHRYQMGDGESRIVARENALRELRKEAASKAGVYIQSETKLDAQGDLSQNIVAISATLVKESHVKEQLELTPSGVAVLKVSARLDVDEAELKNRIKALQSDQDKSIALNKIKNENAKLIAELKELRNALSDKTLTREKANQILQKQSIVYEKLERNEAAASQVFSEGTLFQMAQKQKELEEQIAKDFERDFKSFWLNASKELKAEVYRVNGNTVTVKVKDIKPIGVFEMIKKPGRRSHGDRNNLKAQDFSSKKEKDLISAIAPFLAENTVYLEAEFSSKIIKLPVFGFNQSGFFSHDPVSWPTPDPDGFLSAVSTDGLSKQQIGFTTRVRHGEYFLEGSDVLLVFELTDQELKSASSLDVRFVH